MDRDAEGDRVQVVILSGRVGRAAVAVEDSWVRGATASASNAVIDWPTEEGFHVFRNGVRNAVLRWSGRGRSTTRRSSPAATTPPKRKTRNERAEGTERMTKIGIIICSGARHLGRERVAGSAGADPRR